MTDAAILVIGNEVLSGRTRDANTQTLAKALGGIGIALAESRAIPDDAARIGAAVRELAARHAHVFTSGGIGPTHDDITAEAVAAAFGTTAPVREDARAILEAHYGDDLNDARLRMARIPPGATLIPNPVSAAPGFRLRNVLVMAGVPRIFEAMLHAVLPTLEGGRVVHEASVAVPLAEGELAEPLAALAERMPQVSFGSYPRLHPEGGFEVTVVARSADEAALDAAKAEIERLGAPR